MLTRKKRGTVSRLENVVAKGDYFDCQHYWWSILFILCIHHLILFFTLPRLSYSFAQIPISSFCWFSSLSLSLSLSSETLRFLFFNLSLLWLLTDRAKSVSCWAMSFVGHCFYRVLIWFFHAVEHIRCIFVFRGLNFSMISLIVFKIDVMQNNLCNKIDR